MTFHIYVGERYTGIVEADNVAEAESKARTNWGGNVEAIPVRYRVIKEGKDEEE